MCLILLLGKISVTTCAGGMSSPPPIIKSHNRCWGKISVKSPTCPLPLPCFREQRANVPVETTSSRVIKVSGLCLRRAFITDLGFNVPVFAQQMVSRLTASGVTVSEVTGKAVESSPPFSRLDLRKPQSVRLKQVGLG